MMNSLSVTLAAIAGGLLVVLAGIYWLEPAGSLPSFIPGFEAGSQHIHFKHGLGALISPWRYSRLHGSKALRRIGEQMLDRQKRQRRHAGGDAVGPERTKRFRFEIAQKKTGREEGGDGRAGCAHQRGTEPVGSRCDKVGYL